jgi:hypothetical protein
MGTDRNHRQFLIESVPTYSPTKIVQTVKSLTARQVFAHWSQLYGLPHTICSVS